jgi:hypothetical protein
LLFTPFADIGNLVLSLFGRPNARGL